MPQPPVEPTPSLWNEIVRRASKLRRRYRSAAEGPASTWSLVGRAAQRFPGGALPLARDRDHFCAQWSRAMISVLNDLSRRGWRRGLPAELPEELAGEAGGEPEALDLLQGALERLAELDEADGGNKVLILTLRHFEELPWQRVADALGSNVSAVRREWTVARAWLRRELKRKGLDVDGEA